MARGKRKSIFFQILLIALLLCAIFFVVLTKIIGSRGAAYFFVPNTLFFMLAGSISYGLKEAVGLMVSNRVSKEQYESAGQVVGYAIFTGIILSVITGILLYIFSDNISSGLFRMPLSYLSILVIIPAVPLLIITGVLRGYFEGTGDRNISTQSIILFIIIYCISGTIFAVILKGYGARVEAILRSDEYSFSYGAFGGALGIVIASFFAFIHILTLYLIKKKRSVYRDKRGGVRVSEAPIFTMLNILLNALLPAGLFLVFTFMYFMNGVIFFRAGEDAALFLWGEYFGKSFSAAAFIAILLMLFTYPYARRAIGSIYREDYRSARESLGWMIHRCAGVGIYVSAMVLVLAEDITDSLFSSNGQDTSLYLQLESVVIMLSLFAVMLLEMIVAMKYHKLALSIMAVALLIHLITAAALALTSHLLIRGIIISNMIFYLICAVVSFLFIKRAFQYTQEWFRAFAVTIVGALISAIIGMLINRSLAPLTGKSVSFFITLIICTLLYMIILLALRGYSEDELVSSPLGRIMLSIGRAIHLL